MKKITILTVLVCFPILSSFGQAGWTLTNLSSACVRMGRASLGSKVYFAGGGRGANVLPTNVVDIYDVNSMKWTTSNLSVAREFCTGVSSGSKVIFAGGINMTTTVPSAVVDIYDTITKQWTAAQLSQPRFGVAAVSYGDVVLFAGGTNLQTNTVSATVDIFNTLTGMWSTAALSEARGAMAYSLVGSKAIFAGGDKRTSMSDHVDIYDFIAGTWSTVTLPHAKGFTAAATVGNYVIIGGGITSSNTPTDRVDIYDAETGRWFLSKLSAPRAFLDYAAVVGGKVFFAGGGNFNSVAGEWTSSTDTVDIYDVASDTWTVERMSIARINHGVVANGNQIFVAGGAIPHDMSTSHVDIYTFSTAGIDVLQKEPVSFTVYPNPVKNTLTIALGNPYNQVELSISDISGKIIYSTTSTTKQKIEVSTKDFAEGIYLVRLQTSDFTETKKIIVSK